MLLKAGFYHMNNDKDNLYYRWYSTKGMLPGVGKAVLCYLDNGSMSVLRIRYFEDTASYEWEYSDGIGNKTYGNVMAWMPLPEPYKGD